MIPDAAPFDGGGAGAREGEEVMGGEGGGVLELNEVATDGRSGNAWGGGAGFEEGDAGQGGAGDGSELEEGTALGGCGGVAGEGINGAAVDGGGGTELVGGLDVDGDE